MLLSCIYMFHMEQQAAAPLRAKLCLGSSVWEQRVHGRGGFVLDVHLLTVALPCCRRGALHWLAGGALRSYSQHCPAIPNTAPSFKLLQEFRWLVDTANPPQLFPLLCAWSDWFRNASCRQETLSAE